MELKKEKVSAVGIGHTIENIRARAKVTMVNDDGGVVVRIVRNLVPVLAIYIEGEKSKNRKVIEAFIRKSIIDTGDADEFLKDWKKYDKEIQAQRKEGKA